MGWPLAKPILRTLHRIAQSNKIWVRDANGSPTGLCGLVRFGRNRLHGQPRATATPDYLVQRRRGQPQLHERINECIQSASNCTHTVLHVSVSPCWETSELMIGNHKMKNREEHEKSNMRKPIFGNRLEHEQTHAFTGSKNQIDFSNQVFPHWLFFHTNLIDILINLWFCLCLIRIEEEDGCNLHCNQNNPDPTSTAGDGARPPATSPSRGYGATASLQRHSGLWRSLQWRPDALALLLRQKRQRPLTHPCVAEAATSGEPRPRRSSSHQPRRGGAQP